MLPVVDVVTIRGVVEGVCQGIRVDGECGAVSNVEPAAIAVLPETAPVVEPTCGVVLHHVVRECHGAAEHAQAAAETVAVGRAAGHTGDRHILVYGTVR